AVRIGAQRVRAARSAQQRQVPAPHRAAAGPPCERTSGLEPATLGSRNERELAPRRGYFPVGETAPRGGTRSYGRGRQGKGHPPGEGIALLADRTVPRSFPIQRRVRLRPAAHSVLERTNQTLRAIFR